MGEKLYMTETKASLFYKRKGQSAIEYLMTYGWMLLVVAIVGGAIFATVQGQCTKSSTGFTGTATPLVGFGQTANNNLQVEIRNGASSTITVTSITVTQEDTTNSVDNTTSVDIAVGDSQTFTLNDANLSVSSTDGCNNFDMEVEYDEQGGLKNQVVTGTLTASLTIG